MNFRWLLGAAALIAVFLVVRSMAGRDVPDPAPPPVRTSAPTAVADSPAAAVTDRRAQPQPAEAAPSVAAPTTGDREGVYAFPAPGTKPPLVGIIVPDDYELPPGYLRHHQVTDDGVPLPPVLMYNPYQPPLDHHGQPIVVRGDGVVPPDEAPPGMPVEILKLPERKDPARGLGSLLDDR